ncbi:alpha/beta hydrolase [Glutamicibacter sp.]|uniref:alpha/beta fold hydrolase n=1 Tax=Glutamicibacter sp. TaxID=1931995 RepID=UPI0028BF2FC4|nr:alpha/beta hydrolase [Glutamicibacter sp.]
MKSAEHMDLNRYQAPEVKLATGDGVLVFMIHGQGVDHRLLLPLDPVFDRGRGFERIYLDLPGMGTTPPLSGAGGLPEYAQWLENSIRRIAEGRRFALLGNSMGGVLAQEMADRFPGQILGLALIAPVVFPNSKERNLPARQIASSDAGLWNRLSAEDAVAYREMSVVQNFENWISFKDFALPGIRSANLRALAKLSKRYYLEPPPVQRAGVADIPALILCGQLDHICGFQDQLQLLRRYPKADYRVLVKAGHNLHLDAPEATHQALAAWAAGVVEYAQDVADSGI